MNFDLSDEQRMLQDSVRRLLDTSDTDHAATPEAVDRRWAGYAELGLLGMTFDEADGGLGMGPVETMIVAREIGRANCPTTFVANAVYAGVLVSLAASAAQKAELIPGMIDGGVRVAFAHAEAGSRFTPSHVATAVRRDGENYTISGRKTLVQGGAGATHLVVTARMTGQAKDSAGIALFLAPVTHAGIMMARRKTIDGRMIAEVEFADVNLDPAALLGVEGQAIDVIEAATAQAIVASIHDAAGAMQAMLDLTVEYLKTRKQFGVTIGSFQALQHRAVDMFVEIEQAKSIALYATMQLDADPVVRDQAIGAAKLHVNNAARIVGESAVQLHGAIGMTWESKVGRLFARLSAFQNSFGDTDYWTSRLTKSMPDLLAA